MFSVKPIEDEDRKYDIVWQNWNEELIRFKPKSTKNWNKIRGFSKESTNVAIIEGEIEDYKGILNEFLPSKKEDYFEFKKLAENSFPEHSIKFLTSAYSKLIEIKNSIQNCLNNVLKAESDFGEKERAWLDFMTWGHRGFLIDVMHDLEYVEGFEDSEYYEEAVFIIKKFNIK